MVAVRRLAQERVDWRFMRDTDESADTPLAPWLRFASQCVNALVRIVLSGSWVSRKKQPQQEQQDLYRAREARLS